MTVTFAMPPGTVVCRHGNRVSRRFDGYKLAVAGGRHNLCPRDDRSAVFAQRNLRIETALILGQTKGTAERMRKTLSSTDNGFENFFIFLTPYRAASEFEPRHLISYIK